MNVRIGDKIFPAEVMKTPEETQKGMMGRDHLDGCMVFKMKKGHHSFWMKNCLIPLDIVYVLNKRITRIHKNCEPCDSECPSYKGIGDTVIEFPAGSCEGFNVGDRVNLYLGSPENPVF